MVPGSRNEYSGTVTCFILQVLVASTEVLSREPLCSRSVRGWRSCKCEGDYALFGRVSLCARGALLIAAASAAEIVVVEVLAATVAAEEEARGNEIGVSYSR